MVFSMPMFHDWIPRCIRPWLYVVLAFCFQFSNGMYLGAMNQVVGEWAVMREDVQMCLYATLTGMALYFVVLFRMKFRFTNQKLLMSSALIIFLCQWLATLRLPLPLLWGLCVVCGMAKIQGTFECMSNIQLWMTPKRDFGVFFPLLHIILLVSIEYSGFLAAWFAYEMHWEYMHYFVMLLMLLVQAALTRPVHAMPKIVPLRGIDWLGGVLWMALFLQSAWLLCYGDWLDWWHSPQFRLVCGTSIITFAVCLQRMLFHPHPFYEPAMWRPGILGGCLVSLGWLKLMRWNVYKLIAFGLMFFSLYVGGYYVLLDSGLNIEMLRIPLMCRGFSYAVLCIAFMWCLHEMMSFEHFFQALSIFNVLHMFVGGLVGAALHSYGMKYYMADGFARCSQYIDRVRMSASPADFSSVVSRLVEGVMAQSIKILFGWTLLAGLFFALLMLLWDIPMVRYQIKHIPSWPRVGMGVWRGYRRQQKLHRLRVMRREAAK